MRKQSTIKLFFQEAQQAGRFASLVVVSLLLAVPGVLAQADPLPSWNDGPAKQAIVAFVQTTTDTSHPDYVPPEARIATFDQDGTTWVEYPVYTQARYCFDRVATLAQEKPELKDIKPFKTVLSGDKAAIAGLPMADLEKIIGATMTGMTVEALTGQVQQWLETARDTRWKRSYAELVYQPMLEVMQYLRANGYKTYFVTGGSQDFVRAFAQSVYAIPPEQVVGTMGATTFGYDAAGRPKLTEEPRLLLDDNGPGKPEGIHLMIGRRPVAAFGNSVGDREMLEYTQAGSGARLMMLVHHDDAGREYAYGPASKVGTFTDALMAQAKQQNWVVISMKNDWKRIFPWEQ
ncbi:HAD family hydrolase [Desulfovibrio sp. TomC]|uniref:HAD family hydrolase n=1 Tax=Desulfovibrio sp. TomC TaxID=1562888 RepID=UPI0005734C35|nr:HAD family hydrolase [Desulfovibrio sp. TomC]KHK01339.1 hypothetical protein NY78_3321 [Desulfovibrio sp. TomC]